MKLLKRIFPGNPGVALCLNSSFFGFYAHAGFLLGLRDLGLQFTHVSGASAGALAGGLYCADVTIERMLALFLKPGILKAFQEFRAPFNLLKTFSGMRGATGIFKGHRLLAMIKAEIGDLRIENLAPSFSLSVLDLKNHRTEVIRKGPLAEYILASCAVPGLFQAQLIEDGHFWDGGTADPLPFEHLLEDPQISDIILHIVDSQEKKSHSSFYGALARSHDIISAEILRLKQKLASLKGKRIHTFITATPKPVPGNLKAGARNVNLGLSTVRQNARQLHKLRY
jgi:predicted acylesterase/phospholipase RssA